MKNNRLAQTKSKDRVNKFGEVFTAGREVKAMCDLIQDWSGNVLEPACGTGNFLVEVLERKINSGIDPLEAARQIYGIDIQIDNVIECIERLSGIAPKARHIFEQNIVCGDFLKPETVWFLTDEPQKEE